MMVTLVLKECKKILKSLIFYIYLVLLLIFFFQQMGGTTVAKPIPGSDYYGYVIASDTKEIISTTLESLKLEYITNSYGTYPLGFYKEVTLNEEDQEIVRAVIDRLSEPDIDYDFFLQEMEKVSQLIGNGSNYSQDMIKNNSTRNMTYEEALIEYEAVVSEDQVTRALARLFADYMGIVLGILPVFVVVSVLLADKKHDLQPLLASKKISSFKLVMSRYLALISMMVIPLIFISLIPLSQGLYSAEAAGIQGDYWAFIRIIFGWLLPTIMAVTSLSYLITVLLNNNFAIFIHIGIWLISIFTGSSAGRVGVFGLQLVPRYNKLGSSLDAYQTYREKFGELVLNRVGYSILSIFIMLLAVWLYELRRQGRLSLND